MFDGSDGGGVVHSSLIESYTLLVHTVCTQAMYQHGESRWLNVDQKCGANNTNSGSERNGANAVAANSTNVRSSWSSSSSVLGRHANAA